MKKTHLTILFGGQSAEHDIAIQSAKNVFAAVDSDRYCTTLIYICPEGGWYRLADQILLRESHSYKDFEVIKTAGNQVQVLMGKKCWQVGEEIILVDVVFPVLHGPNGEDGKVQAFLDLMHLPYVGCGAMSSALCMDKDLTKRLVAHADILTARWFCIHEDDEVKPDFNTLAQNLGTPMFVKPNNLGSSIAISKVETAEEFELACATAFKYDNKILVEEFIEGREIECAVLGNHEAKCARPGEVIPAHDFYDFDAKYTDPDGARVVVPTELPIGATENIQVIALQVYRVLQCAGMARVDFFLTEGGQVFLNEVNPIPGFTGISLYPKAWAEDGKRLSVLIDELIELGLNRAAATAVKSLGSA